jgi:hypothetical protein
MSRSIKSTCWLFLLVGCTVPSIEPTPFIGLAPRSLLVAPIDNRSGQPGLAEAFMAGLPAQLEVRGYYVYPTDTGLSWMRDQGWLRGQEPTVESLIRVGQEFHLDGVLVVTVRSWHSVFERVLESLDYDVGYQILSTIDGRIIWEHQAAGAYQRHLEPIRTDDRYLGPSFEPSMADISESFRFRDDASVVSALSRMVFQYLPLVSDPQ